MNAIAEFFQHFNDHDVIRDAVATVLALLLIVLLRSVVARSVERSDLPANRRRQMLVQTRNAAILIFVAATAIIWAQELQTVALSLAAIAVALVIATKELILCLSGALVRLSSDGFSLGDRIEVNGMRGDVIDIGALTTTIFEVGPGPSIHRATGRTIVLPNSIFLTTPVINETFTDDYVLHATHVPLPRTDDWRMAEACLLEAAQAECAEFLDEARANMERIGRKHGLDAPAVEPRVWLRLVDPDELELIVRFPSPSRVRGQVEQAVLRRYLTALTRAQKSPAHAASSAIRPST